jgi:predicted Fe-S protein YdhL (DUF1289 family)
MRRSAALIAALLLVVACARTTADRAHWLQMSPTEKSLYVGSLLGHEQAKQAKGGNDLRFDRPAADYVRLIDAAYAHGDHRDVDAVFESLGVRASPR